MPIATDYITLDLFRRAELSPDTDDHVYEDCVAAVRRMPFVIKYIRQDLVDEALCRLAVETDGRAIKAVPEAFLNAELSRVAIAGGAALKDIQTRYVTPEMQLEAVRQRAFALNDIPYNQQALEMIEVAYQAKPAAIRFASPALLTTEFSLEAVKSHARTLHWIPDEVKTYDMCLSAVSLDSDVLHAVPAVWRDDRLCRTALNSIQHTGGHNKEFIGALPEEWLTPDICLQLIAKDAYATGVIQHVALPAQNALQDPTLLRGFITHLSALNESDINWTRHNVLPKVANAIVDSIPLDKQFRDDWAVDLATPGRSRLDELGHLAQLLGHMLPDDNGVQQFCQRVDTLVEALMRRRHRPSREAATDAIFIGDEPVL